MIQYDLNEEAILPNVPTYDLQKADERKFVFDHLDQVVIKRTNQSGGYGMVMGNKAREEELIQAKTDIQNDPRGFIAQPIIKLSTVPCFIDGAFRPRHVDLRPYALCGPEGVRIVPGGLTRVALKEGSLVVNSSQGGGSKDTWIVNLRRRSLCCKLNPYYFTPAAMMLSRIADSLFWLNRYMERADGLLRVTRTNYIMALDEGTEGSLTWRPALVAFARLDDERNAALEHDTPGALTTLLVDSENLNSFKVMVTRARENARGAQDHVTKEVWEQLNQMYHLVNQPSFAQSLTTFRALDSIDVLMRQSRSV